jgi:hypothetical protein
MRTFSLDTYTIRVFERINDTRLEISNFGNENDLFNILIQFIAQLNIELSNDEQNQIVLKSDNIHQNGRHISGMILKGDYGIESDIIDVESEDVMYRRNEAEAELLPFYFLFVIPSGADEGILLLQKTGNLGIKGIFEDELNRYIFENYSDYRVRINRLIPSELLEEYLGNGRVTKLRFVRFGIPSDITDSIDVGHLEDEGVTELIVKAKRGKSLSGIGDLVRSVFERQRNVHDFEYDNIKVEVEIGGKYRTIDLQQPDNLRATYDITDNIETQGGNPIFESINQEAEELAIGLINSLGLDNMYYV